MHIRLHRPSERPALLELWERSVRATHHFLTETDITFYRPLVADFFAGEGLELYVLTDEAEAPAGFLAVAGNAIDTLFLDPGRRGRGAGRQLVDYAQRFRRGALTGTGRPFPLLHMRRDAPVADDAGPRR